MTLPIKAMRALAARGVPAADASRRLLWSRRNTHPVFIRRVASLMNSLLKRRRGFMRHALRAALPRAQRVLAHGRKMTPHGVESAPRRRFLWRLFKRLLCRNWIDWRMNMEISRRKANFLKTNAPRLWRKSRIDPRDARVPASRTQAMRIGHAAYL